MPNCETTPWKARVKWRSTSFRAVLRARPSRTWSMREALPRQGFTHPSRSIFTHWGGVMPRPACRLPSASDGSPLECAVTAQIAHSNYADRYARLVRILGAYRQQVRTEVRTSGSHPLTRTRCEPGQRLPHWLPREVTNASGCQALVSTVVSRLLQCFPLATWLGPDQTHGAGVDWPARTIRAGIEC